MLHLLAIKPNDIMKKTIAILSFLLISLTVFSQKPEKLSSNQIYEKIQKLNFLGTALYIAAHPDDENTRLISYLSNHVKARTGYLSLTRGDGGQNLIGPEIRELLGVIRTQELLAARRVDGGEQFFTRANDFGFSKHPKETLKIWDKEKVLSDVVWAIRTFKPDVIINRFNHRTPGTTHGHHTSSAMLSIEAFDLVSDATKFTNQLEFTETWQPKRLFFNTSSWFYKNEDDFRKATVGKLTSVDVGVYYPLKGLSNNEVASMASSQHLCQGFGRLTTRGSQNEYIEFLKAIKKTKMANKDPLSHNIYRVASGKYPDTWIWEYPGKSLVEISGSMQTPASQLGMDEVLGEKEAKRMNAIYQKVVKYRVREIIKTRRDLSSPENN